MSGTAMQELETTLHGAIDALDKMLARAEQWKAAVKHVEAERDKDTRYFRAEVDRLTAEVDPENLHFVMSHPEAVARQMTRDAERVKELEGHIERLTAELEEARAVLTHIYDVTYYKNIHPGMDVEKVAHYINQKARAALEGDERTELRELDAIEDYNELEALEGDDE